MNSFKTCVRLLKLNWRSLFLFEVLYKAVSSAVFTPLIVALFNVSLKLAGIAYLSDDTFAQFLRSPFTVLVLILVAIVSAMVILIEISAVIRCFHASYNHERISVIEMCFSGFMASVKLLKRTNVLMILFVILLLPLTNIAIVSGFLSSWKVPDFVLAYLNSHAPLKVSFWILSLLLAFITIRWIFCLHSFTIHGLSFNKSHIESAELVKGRYIKTAVLLLAWTLLTALMLVIAILLGTGVISLLGRLLHSFTASYGVMLGSITVYVSVILFIYSIFSLPITVSFISSMYYENLERLNIEIAPYAPSAAGKSRVAKKLNIILIAAVAVNLVYLFIGLVKADSSPVSELHLPTVTAHRGDSVSAPENTLPAFELAADKLADFIELDVGQTKDGVLIIVHDSNLKRISGLDKNIWDVTYDEIKELDVGGWFSDEFRGTKICTLQEAVDFARGKIKLQIELKPTGMEKDFVKSVVDLIVKNRFEDQCILASLDFNTVMAIKNYNPDISVAYITAVAYGDLPKSADIDVFSVESSFITKSIVKKIHASGKEIYAWTVNKEDGIRKMISLGVDSIVTDDPAKAKELILSYNINEDLLRYIEFVSGYRRAAEE